MPRDAAITETLVAWGVAGRPLPGQTVSGDLHLVKPVSDGVLLAVVDGLGHGELATAASKTALEVLERQAGDRLSSLVLHCHAALAGTRGVVMTLTALSSSGGQLTWMGVGNVEGVLLRGNRPAGTSPERVLLRGGIVGYRLPELQTKTLALASGDLLVFVTDGIRSGFSNDLDHGDTPQRLADRILERYFKGTDDALVLVVRYVGPEHE